MNRLKRTWKWLFRPRTQIIPHRMKTEEELKQCFVSGPDHHLWQGVEHIIVMLADVYLDEVSGPAVDERAKAAAVDKIEAVKEVLSQMYAMHEAVKFDANVATSDDK